MGSPAPCTLYTTPFPPGALDLSCPVGSTGALRRQLSMPQPSRWLRHLVELRVSANKQQIELRFFNPNWVSLLSDGTCVKPRVQAWSSYSSTTIRRSYVWGALKRMQGYGCDPAAMQRLAGRPFINELRQAGWPIIFIYYALKNARDSVLLPDAKPELLAVTLSLRSG